MSKTIATVVGKMVAELETLKSNDERERAFAGARAVLGMTEPMMNRSGPTADSVVTKDPVAEGISSAGVAWINKHGLSQDMIDQYFHVADGKVTLIGDPIGNGKRVQTTNTYLLTGIASLFEGGKPDFTDETARNYCVDSGCYDSANHAKTLTQFGNQITGSKKNGWRLTSPGLTAAARLLNGKETT